MNKLTEIKESIPVAEKFIEQNIILKQLGLDGFTKEVFEDMRYLISLLEEKDKAQREQIKWFSNQMEQRLKENDHKTGWEDCDRMFLLNRLEANFHSLWAKQQAYGACFDAEGTIRKAANISNFAMMIADNARKALNTSSNSEGDKP